MSGDFSVDTESLWQFRGAVERVQTRAAELRGFVDSAALAPGTFTRTQAGQAADEGHAQMLDGIRRCTDKLEKLLQGHAGRVGASVDNYEAADSKHATAMAGLQEQLDNARRV